MKLRRGELITTLMIICSALFKTKPHTKQRAPCAREERQTLPIGRLVRRHKIHQQPHSAYLGVALLGLAGAAGEDNEAALVLLQASNVDLHALDGPVLAAVVDADADGAGSLKNKQTSERSRHAEAAAKYS